MDPFATLGAERRFDLDLGALEKTHRELSRALHPDKFAQSGASERRAALEKSATVNEAWRILRDPIRRAEALFQLAGFLTGDANEPKPSGAFLMEMMEEREALAEARAARDLGRIQKLAVCMQSRTRDAEAKLTSCFASDAPSREALTALLPVLGELRFYRRFLDEVEAIQAEADEALALAGAS